MWHNTVTNAITNKGVKTITMPTRMADVIQAHTIMRTNIFEWELLTMKLNK